MPGTEINTLERYLQTTSIHGLRYLTRGEGLIQRLIWLVLVVAMFTASLWLIGDSFKAWQIQPKVTSLDFVDVGKVPFPDVTVCSKTSQKWSEVMTLLASVDTEGAIFQLFGDNKDVLYRWLVTFVVSPLVFNLIPDQAKSLKMICSGLLPLQSEILDELHLLLDQSKGNQLIHRIDDLRLAEEFGSQVFKTASKPRSGLEVCEEEPILPVVEAAVRDALIKLLTLEDMYSILASALANLDRGDPSMSNLKSDSALVKIYQFIERLSQRLDQFSGLPVPVALTLLELGQGGIE